MSSTLNWRSAGVGYVAMASLVWACGGDEGSKGNDVDAGDSSPTADAADLPDASLPMEMESEPNDGASVTEFNELTVGAVMQGAIGSAGDSDVFLFDAEPGKSCIDCSYSRKTVRHCRHT